MARILLITNIFPPMIGGPAVFIDRLAGQLASRGHQVTVVCSGDGPVPAGYDAARPFRVRRVDVGNRYVYEILIRLVLAFELLRHRLVLVNGLEGYMAPIARWLRRRFILKVVGDSVWEQGRNWGVLTDGFDAFQQRHDKPARLLGMIQGRQKLLASASVVVTPGAWLAGVVEKWASPSPAIRVIRNGAPLDVFDGAVVRARMDGPLELLFVGRLTNWKGVETLLLALQGLENVHLTLVGDGPELPMLIALAQQLGLKESVSFAGKCEQAQVHDHLRQAHVFLLPSNYEGLSHALLEAGAAGLARVASSVGGNAELIVDNEDGLLLPYGDVFAWRASIIRLRDDETLRQRLAGRAIETTRRFDFNRTVTEFAELLEAQA